MAEPVVISLGTGTIEGTTAPVISTEDGNNVNSIILNSTFNVSTDILQGYVYDIDGIFIDRITTGYEIDGLPIGEETDTLVLAPGQDLQANGYTQGDYQVLYNFVSPLVDNNPNFFIVEISLDRTELRINSSNLLSTQLRAVYQTLLADLNDTATFEGFYLDFGSNQLQFAVNVGYDSDTVLIKLYEPLDDSFGPSSNFNFLAKKADSQAYQVNFPQEEIILDTKKYLRGPNLNLKTNTQTNSTTEYKSINTLVSASTDGITNQLQSILVENRAELNTDYTDYNNFVFFSSANTRLTNFNYKVTQIESHEAQIATLNGLTGTPVTELSASKAFYEGEIRRIIKNFDGYDYYLYYESSSYAWPKQNSTKPYILYSYTSSEATNWLTSQAASASAYDRENLNNLYEIFPSYIKDDEDNSQFQLFAELTAQMFDEIWIYTKALENRQDGDNSLSGGISIDLVADALRSYGLDIYESSFTNSDLFTGLLGITETGGTLPPTGSEVITNYVTASAETIPSNDAQKLIYKRLYHNLPYLLKKKGTTAGLRVLLNCYGIPDTILRISEFGGKDKNINTWDNWYNQYNYSYNTSGSGYISTPWEGAGFISTWVAASPISLPLVPNGTYNMTVDWGDGTTDTITAWDDAAKTHNYASSGTYNVTITGTIKGFAFNNTGYTSSLTDIRSFGPLELNTSASFYGADELGPSAVAPASRYKLTATDMPRVSTTSMKDFFRGANNLSGSIDKWNTETVLTMERAFQDATLFNTPLPWDTSNVTTLKHTFKNARDFNQTLSWDTGLVTDMSGTFAEAVSYNKAISWDTDNVTTFAHMFESASSFNSSLTIDTPSATTLEGMFKNAGSFNQPISFSDISTVQTMKSMFEGAFNFNGDFTFLGSQFTNVSDTSFMFKGARAYGFGRTPGQSGGIDEWYTGNVFTMESMFEDTDFFNTNLIRVSTNKWNTANVQNMSKMFKNATSFTGYEFTPTDGIANWITSNVSDMSEMFSGASSFNASLVASSTPAGGIWRTDAVTTMRQMFSGSTVFNQDISNWEVGNVNDMSFMFYGADNFNQNLGSWDVSSLLDATGMFSAGPLVPTSSLSQINYDNLLIGWAAQSASLQPSVTLDVDQYFTLSSPASASRAILTSPPLAWNITDLGGI